MRKTLAILSIVASIAGCATSVTSDPTTQAVLDDADNSIRKVAMKCGSYRSPSYAKAVQFADAGDLSNAQIEAAKAMIHAEQQASKCK